MGQSVNQGVATTVLSSSTDNVSSSNISKSQPLTSIGISAPISQPQQILPSSSTPLPKAKPVSVAHVENSALIAPEKALEQILAQNFDRISAPAIITIFKYFSNIVSNPMDSKYKSINLTNKVFLDNVRPVKFALEYLASVGFVSNGPTSIVYPDETTEDLKAQLQLLDGAMNQLNIPIEDRPRFIVASPSDPRMSTVELTPFDPFKSSVVRNAKQVLITKDNILFIVLLFSCLFLIDSLIATTRGDVTYRA